jgi:uroporphyrinogen decarboxylase
MTTQPHAMTAGERVRAALEGAPVDRVPFCFWHHFRPEGSGERMAQLTLEFFHQKFDLDIVKIMPDLPYPDPHALQWSMVPRLSLDNGSFEQQLLCISILREQLGPDYPLILTLFSPFTYAIRFLGKAEAIEQARQDFDLFARGLMVIAQNLRDLIHAAIDAGASGVFFSCMGATNIDLTRDEYARIARPYDLMALEGAHNGWLNVVHIHADPSQQGDEIYFDSFTDYPVSVMSWSDRLTGPSLSEALSMTDKCLMGGLWERGPLTHGSETELADEIRSAVSQTNGRRLILTNGCSIPDDTPEEWLHTARRLLDRVQ